MSATITQEDVQKAKKQWGEGIIAIGQAFTNKEDYVAVATNFINDLYDFQNDDVLFKPTLAYKDQFRNKLDDALSYFVASSGLHEEDSGFALKPWKKIVFQDSGIRFVGDIATIMGNYFLTDFDNNEIKVEYSFVYRRDENDDLKIILHHSSFPFKPA